MNFTAKRRNKRNIILKDKTMKKEKYTAAPNLELKMPHFPRTYDRAFCPRCQKPVNLMFFDEAAGFYKTQIAAIAAIAETGNLHRIHNSKGEILICSESLFQEFSQQKTQKLDVKLLPRLI